MNYTKTICFIALLFPFREVAAQQCGSCKTTPKIATFGFDIQVPQPNAADGTENMWPEWKNLFILAGSVAANLKASEAGCIITTMPPSYDKEDGEEVSVAGERFVNLPSNPNISPDLSVYGDYLLTGAVSKAANGYNLHVEVQSSCNRKVVATADVSFQLSSVMGNVSNIAQQAVAQLSPLTDKIKKFELQERKERTDFALGGSDRELIKLTPAKKNLVTGQETDVEVALADCDGVPLPGREINFTKGTIGGMPITGTIGGIITPSKITTDASGKAKVKFKKTATAAQPAIINTHSLTSTSLNCRDAFIGSAQVDALPAFKITVRYMKTESEDFSMNSNEDRVAFQASEQKKVDVASSFSLLYYPASVPKDGEQMIIDPELAKMPQFNKGKMVLLHNDGYSEFTISEKPLELTASPFGTPPDKPEPQFRRYFSASPLPPTISFIITNNNLVFFSSDVSFPEKEDQELNSVGAGFGIAKNDKKYFPLQPKKVTDPNSSYKWVYELEYKNEQGGSNKGKVFSAGIKETEIAVVQIWKNF